MVSSYDPIEQLMAMANIQEEKDQYEAAYKNYLTAAVKAKNEL